MGEDANGRATGARERIMESSYGLFARHGIHAVGIDRIVAEARVAKMTLYRHFASKEELVLAFLDQREQRWTRGWLQAEIERREERPERRLLATFDVLGEWFARRDYEGCSFVRTLMESGAGRDAVHRAAVAHLGTIRGIFTAYAKDAGLSAPTHVAADVQSLMMGAITAASAGEAQAAERARALARTRIEEAGGAL